MSFPDFGPYDVTIIHQGTLADDFKLRSSRAVADVKAGLIAAITADYEVDLCGIGASGVIVPVGIFVYPADNGSLLPSPTKVHGQITIAKQFGSFETTVYENLTYVVGQKLYCSANSKLTNVVPSTVSGAYKDYEIGIVTKIPGTEGVLGFDLRI